MQSPRVEGLPPLPSPVPAPRNLEGKPIYQWKVIGGDGPGTLLAVEKKSLCGLSVVLGGCRPRRGSLLSPRARVGPHLSMSPRFTGPGRVQGQAPQQRFRALSLFPRGGALRGPEGCQEWVLVGQTPQAALHGPTSRPISGALASPGSRESGCQLHLSLCVIASEGKMVRLLACRSLPPSPSPSLLTLVITLGE